MEYKETRLWTKTLAPQNASGFVEAERARLASSIDEMHQRAAVVAGEIARDLPAFTSHDITHIDALWEAAELIAGPDYPLTPAEGFILGAAFLVHDLGLGLSAWPGGLSELRSDRGWTDAIVEALRRHLGRAPSKAEIESPGAEIVKLATADMLQLRHAERSEDLAKISWRDPAGGTEYHLLEDPELRDNFGGLIGRIAHSHWWSVSRLNSEFRTSVGAIGRWPNDWTVDPLKLAALLRVADASHLDERRAPGFLRALRRPMGDSREHWIFQERLHKPRLVADRLIYTAARPFGKDEAGPWWLCFEVLRGLDKELHETDSLLADEGRARFVAHGVAGVDAADRLSEYVRVSGWHPVDARVHVSDVLALVRHIGGEALYGGHDSTVPLRELIQNAVDAVRARRLLEGRDDAWGTITVRFASDQLGHWIEVEDTGIGMSQKTLSEGLLDFGRSYWGSREVRSEHPGLWGKGFEPTGRFGIGFFSIFMWGKRVQVTSRPYKEGRSNTSALEFTSGLGERPLLRPAAPLEQLIEGGTRVRVWLDVEPPRDMASACAAIAPALDINLDFEEEGRPRRVIGANDWISLDAASLIARFRLYSSPQGGPTEEELGRIRLVKDQEGRPVIRAAVTRELCGVFSYKGLSVQVPGCFCGVLVGQPTNATRTGVDVTSPLLGEWATEQAQLISQRLSAIEQIPYATRLVNYKGCSLGQMKVAQAATGFLSQREVHEWISHRDCVRLLNMPYDGILEPNELAVSEHELAFRMGHSDIFCKALSEAWVAEIAPLSNAHFDLFDRRRCALIFQRGTRGGKISVCREEIG